MLWRKAYFRSTVRTAESPISYCTTTTTSHLASMAQLSRVLAVSWFMRSSWKFWIQMQRSLNPDLRSPCTCSSIFSNGMHSSLLLLSRALIFCASLVPGCQRPRVSTRAVSAQVSVADAVCSLPMINSNFSNIQTYPQVLRVQKMRLS
eukprot:COSAG05_NODE_996_length_6253_cov_7.771856_2_plen_148_part_00